MDINFNHKKVVGWIAGWMGWMNDDCLDRVETVSVVQNNQVIKYSQKEDRVPHDLLKANKLIVRQMRNDFLLYLPGFALKVTCH